MEIGGQGHEGEVVGRHGESGYTYKGYRVGMAVTIMMHTILYSSVALQSPVART